MIKQIKRTITFWIIEGHGWATLVSFGLCYQITNGMLVWAVHVIMSLLNSFFVYREIKMAQAIDQLTREIEVLSEFTSLMVHRNRYLKSKLNDQSEGNSDGMDCEVGDDSKV